MAAARPAVVGGFVLGGLALAVAAIVFFGGTNLFTPTTRAVVYFEGSVAGLDVGAPVTFRGVTVGSVQRVALNLSASGARIPVTIELRPGQVIVNGADAQEGPNLERLVRAGLRAQLAIQSFVTGLLRVDLDFRPGTPAELVESDRSGLPQIPAVPSDLERLRSTLSDVPVQDVVQTAQRTLVALERLAGRLDTEIGPLLGSAQRGVDAAARTLDTTGQAMAQLQADASRTLNHASSALQELQALVASTQSQVDNRGADLARVLGSVDRVARQAETLIVSLEGLTAPRSQFRGELEAAARDLAASASSLRGFARAIERDPSAVLRGRSAR